MWSMRARALRKSDWQLYGLFCGQATRQTDPLNVQLKGRCTLAKKNMGKDLYICFHDLGAWYVDDELLAWVQQNMNVTSTDSWNTAGLYSFPGLSAALKRRLESYRLGGAEPGR